MGCMMKKCKACGVSILDQTVVCPLCRSVLEGEAEKERVPMYPDVKGVTRKLNFIMQLYTFLAIVSEATLIIINYVTFSGIWWSVISGVGILYFYLTLRYSIQKYDGYQRTILLQLIGGVLLTLVIDFILGYQGWSVNFVLPGAILLIDLTIVILMLVNLTNWQSYILWQLLTLLLSVLVFVLWKINVIVYPIVTIVAVAVSVVMFVGTLIFGERRAKNELKRRFHM